MVWWKAVSNTPACGTPAPKTFCALRMPITCGGLCSGASLDKSSMVRIISSVTRTLLLNFSPPCTTRWPMASISSLLATTAPSPSVIIFSMALKASAWVGSSSFSSKVLSFALCTRVPPSMPMRSHRPLHITVSVSMSSSWYFSEDDPQLITNTFIITPNPSHV